jgi:hypothetical protein
MNKKNNCLQINCFFAFIGSRSLRACCFSTWATSHDNNYINWYIIRFRVFCCYNVSIGWLSLEHVLNFCLSKTIRCTMFRAIIDNTRIFQWHSSWFNRLCNYFSHWFNNFSGCNKNCWFFFLPVMTCLFCMTFFTTI